MKEHIDTIPLNDAFRSGDECPFCYLERLATRRTVRYVIGPGASYMEPDVRAQTTREGFCGQHMQMLYDYGNALGNALILQSRYQRLTAGLREQIEGFRMPKKSLLGKKTAESPLAQWAKEESGDCLVCSRVRYHMKRYMQGFFALLDEPEFKSLVEASKGFCLRHFPVLLDRAAEELPEKHRQWFYDTALSLMEENLRRVQGDIDHFVEMFDYRMAGADWGDSKDAVARGMQKLQGLYVADEAFKED